MTSSRNGPRVLFDVTDLMSQIGNGHHPTGIPRVVADFLVPLIGNVPNLVPVFFSRVSRAYCQVDGLSLAAFDVGYVRKYSPESRDHLRRLCAYIGVLRSGRVVPRAGDTLLILGGGWHDERRHRYLFGRSAALCRTIWFCHDLIPVLYPQFDVQGEVFARWLDAALRHRNEFICAPRFVEADLRNYALQRGADVRISIVPLAHEFRPIDGSVSPAVARAASGAMVLCVGSIVERKRQLNLAQVWARLHEEFGDRLPVLVMAGALIDAGALKNFLQGTADVGGKVALLGHVSDPELAFLYERCSFTVYPSLNEGWGLPVGESLWMGKPCLCSNLTSLPEAGGTHAVYFDPRDEEGMIWVLRQALRGEFSALPPPRDKLRTWQQVGADIASLVYPRPAG